MDNVLIIADIEGSSGCWSDEASAFKTEEWAKACVQMSLDINKVAAALFNAGVKQITVKDFHRSAYNLLPELIDRRVKIVQGYKIGPVPGLGDPGSAEALMLIGMHAASGSEGFLAHTLTSRISSLEVNGRLMPELELFSSSLAPYGIRPVFFTGCPVACAQAENIIDGIATYSINKSNGKKNFDIDKWREGLAESAVKSLKNHTPIYLPEGPFNAVITLRDGEVEARQLGDRWKHSVKENRIILETKDIHTLYNELIRICYLTPLIEKMIVPSMSLYNLYGRAGLSWVRRKIKY